MNAYIDNILLMLVLTVATMPIVLPSGTTVVKNYSVPAKSRLTIWVDQEGPACHTNRRSCFYTAVRAGDEVEILKPLV